MFCWNLWNFGKTEFDECLTMCYYISICFIGTYSVCLVPERTNCWM